MTTTERDPSHGGYEAASERRSEPKEPPMTKTQDELLAAVERLDGLRVFCLDEAIDPADVLEQHERAGYAEDFRLILAALRPPDPEVERLREEIEVAAVHLQLAGGWLREAGDDGQRANTLLNASNRARAALSSNSGGR